MSAQDGPEGFPREAFAALVRRMPRYGRLAWALARDPRLSRARRAAVLAGAAYLVSPIDLVPGIIPVLGQLDDLAVALTAIRFALNGLRPAHRAEVLAGPGLTSSDVDTDLRTTGAIARWLGRTGLRTGRRLASAALDLAGRSLEQLNRKER